jgi:hypothetical protein
MKNLNVDQVNTKNSVTWTACNDDSRSNYWRSVFLEKYGGEFIKEGRYLKWQEIEIKPNHYYLYSNADDAVVKINHMSNFCKKNNLNRSAMYEVKTGKRKQHKGYKYLGEEINGNTILERRNQQ